MSTELTAAHYAPATARAMRDAALRFLDSLDDGQRRTATYEFGNDERYQWSFLPDRKIPLTISDESDGDGLPRIEPLPGELWVRNGLPLRDMTQPQRHAALRLMTSGLGERASKQARLIVDHEVILREWEAIENFVGDFLRDPDRYYFTVFGDPSGDAPWAWRAGGHHIGIQFAVIDREVVSPFPLFLGANPATVRHGPAKGMRILSAEEDLARTLLSSLDDSGKRRAIVDPVAPYDILTVNYRTVDTTMPMSGLPYSLMSGDQRQHLVRLIRHYVTRSARDIAANEWRRIESAGLDSVTFAWAGPEQRGLEHYYSVVGPKFIIEYDNTQNEGNHIHSVIRDTEHDWGEDLLSAHYANSDHH